ncbi:MAG TPA: alternative ribosome rescue aminoacyl-tRNA hydrolase ArfB [Gemmatimonadaceae bacterium]|jgi:ribosome-associated protein|nr:alternative ribosome rescue aminoacyl-tRNA hydrolase ArfB [Gemmatimonadaceae bacterium]
MTNSESLTITSEISIPRSELTYRATRSGGPGGQHVNTSSTRIELLWDLSGSRAVSDEQRERLRAKLAARLDGDGMVRVVASDRRSQQQNRAAADERLSALVRHALHVPKKRRKTKPPAAAKERRIKAKKLRSERKRDRRVELD